MDYSLTAVQGKNSEVSIEQLARLARDAGTYVHRELAEPLTVSRKILSARKPWLRKFNSSISRLFAFASVSRQGLASIVSSFRF